MAVKKIHPADIAAESQMIEAIRGADHFLASRFRGAGSYDKVSATTVRGAIRAGRLMEETSRTTQRSMIYAVSKDGKATFLTAALINRLLTMQGNSK